MFRGLDAKQLWEKILELAGPSERACVLVCAATIERCLAEVLRLHFTLSTKADTTQIASEISNEITKFISYDGNPDPPLGSSTVQARLLRLCGVIDGETTRAIRKFLTIRNRFAHLEHPSPLTTSEVKEVRNFIPAEVLRTVPILFAEVDKDIEVPGEREGEQVTYSAARINLVTTAMILANLLKRAAKKIALPKDVATDDATNNTQQDAEPQ